MARRVRAADSAVLALRRSLASDRDCLSCVAALLCESRGLPLRGLPRPRSRDLDHARGLLAAIGWSASDAPDLGAVHELLIRDSAGRRSRGAWFTSRELARALAEETMAPLLGRVPPLAIRVLDPAMGSGRLLLAAGELLAASGEPRGAVACACLHGRDLDPLAVEVARTELWLWVGEGRSRWLEANLREGDSLLAPPPLEQWHAVLANPPWLAHSGRATHPLEPALRAHYASAYPSFRGYPTTHGMFLELGARLLRPDGRMGFLVPASVAELPGYRATRASVDALCTVEEPLRDWAEEGFAGVTTPCMSLIATRTEGGRPLEAHGSPWRLAGPELGNAGRLLLERMSALPTLPPETFRDPGLRTGAGDRGSIGPVGEAAERHDLPLHQGRDVSEFALAPTSLRGDGDALGARLRPPEAWAAVAVLIRQTARWPIAAASDGLPFRNSLLAGYATEAIPRVLLLALLNSSLVRWLHCHRNRDARQATHPQVKVAALRAIPAPPCADAATRAALIALGEAWPGAEARGRLDALVANAYGLSEAEAQLVSNWERTGSEPRRTSPC